MKRLTMILLLLLLAGCNQLQGEEELPFLDVALTVTPEEGQANEPILFEAKITYGSEEVTDADDVVFEIWRSHDEEHESFKIEHSENGIYRLEKSFEREGTYYIISHVTARHFHNMPKKTFVIGEPSEPEEKTNSTYMEKDNEEEHGDEH